MKAVVVVVSGEGRDLRRRISRCSRAKCHLAPIHLREKGHQFVCQRRTRSKRSKLTAMIYLTTAETSVCETCFQLGSRGAREILSGSFEDSQFRDSGFFYRDSRVSVTYEDRNERSNFGANSRTKSRLVLHLRCKIDLFEKSFHPSNLILELCALLYIFRRLRV